MKAFTLLTALFMLMLACSTLEICDDSGESDLVIKFKQMQGDGIADTIISGVSIYGIRAGKADSLIYDSLSTARILLPLDPHHQVSSFVMNINEVRDTLHISHQTGFYLISYACGYAAVFTLEENPIEHDSVLFNTVEIRKPVIDAETDQDEEHLWLYF